MSDKQAYELTREDLINFSAWFFPMDATVEDELTVRPLTEKEACTAFQVLVRTSFVGARGSVYLGFLYWNSIALVEYVKPVILSEGGEAISFWNGIIKPQWNGSEFSASLRADLPISYMSEPFVNLPSLRGKLEGLYYLAEDQVCCIK
ncbi:hypothetical protein PspCFBP13528_06975 [Pseudomonas sp. CFBP13528]|uniref:hypothetical protein n=1 Tax=Pseudomonas sp. CFBP13528 TaxID=2184006 RepID=UPI0010C0CF70|nr:hypothetical protein [Pseudomonas sp. CFBP13528]TKK33442.1 hypothetical protein PspCFBP13528_06975 [Pseudomonas sp. CFBP13528]